MVFVLPATERILKFLLSPENLRGVTWGDGRAIGYGKNQTPINNTNGEPVQTGSEIISGICRIGSDDNV